MTLAQTPFNLRTADLRKLNSLTKYPSIPTYHALDPKNGSLLEQLTTTFDGPVLATEKVDGTNARLVLLPDGSYVIGSREELLYARGDLIGNPALGIAETLRPIADRLCEDRLCDARGTVLHEPGAILVLFGEVFGGKVTANSKQYTAEGRVGFRLFDALRLTDFAALLEMSNEQISAWRDAGRQPFADEEMLIRFAGGLGVQTTPRIAELRADELPTGIDETLALLRRLIDRTRCALDERCAGRPEGLVLRTPTRSRIAKLRFEDYERTLRRRK